MTIMSWSESGSGTGSRKTVRKTPKSAVFAPTPSASVTSTVSENPGRLRSARNANWKSFIQPLIRSTSGSLFRHARCAALAWCASAGTTERST